MSMPIFSEYKWPDPNVRVSLVPDGTPLYLNSPDGPKSNLFALYNGRWPQDQWQNEIKKAFAAWQKHCGLVFTLVPDDGSPLGSHGQAQGDPRFGDIRISADIGLASLDLTSYPPLPGSTSTSRGMVLNGTMPFGIGTNPDLQSVVIHCIGIAIGMMEGQPCGPNGEIGYCSVLNGVADYNTGPYRDIYSWDMRGGQTLYGQPATPPPPFVLPPTAPQFTNAVFLDPNGEYQKGARIQDCYTKMLKRVANSSETTQWVNTATPNILNLFAQSAEFYGSCIDLADWITRVYERGLNRTPSQAEINMWIDVLT